MSFTDIFAAVQEGTVDDVKYFIDEKGVDVNAPNKFGYTPLHSAAGGNNAELVRFLVLEGNANVNAKDERHSGTSLHIAVRNGNSAEIIKFLVSEGNADVNAKENDGSTPLHSAVMKNNVEFAKILISADADVNAKNNKGLTPLGFALFIESIELTNILIDAGADVNAKDQPNGGTPLHGVALKKNVELAKILISAGADANAKDNDGLTPLDFAKENGDMAMAQYLSNVLSAGITHNSEECGTPIGENTLSNTETKRPIIIMLVGAFIGIVFAVVFAVVNIPHYVGDIEFWFSVLTGAFFGLGLGTFLKYFKKFFLWFCSIEKYIEDILVSIVSPIDKNILWMVRIFLIFWAAFIALWLALITSPFVAILQCLSQYSPRGRKFTEYWFGTDFTKDLPKPEESPPQPVKKTVSKKPLFWTIFIALGVILISLALFTGEKKTEEQEIATRTSTDTVEKSKKQERAIAITLGSFTDYRDNKTYKTTKIGTQTWLAENLNYNAKGSVCYDSESANCDKYGRHYNWNAALKACPKGWHLPANAEWDKLYRFADGTSGTDSPYESPDAGKRLKAKSSWNDFNGNSGNGLDVYGFAALPGGSHYTGKFHLAGDNGYWWSASESDGGNAYYRFMLSESGRAGWNNKAKSLLLNVRCVMD